MTKKLRALIVDDEAPARYNLKDLLKKIPLVEVIGEAESIDEAIAAIKASPPDIIFLDIQFPNETGFDLFERIDVSAEVIFVTAFDAYALRAFEVNAIDYLLKPVNPERLRQTLERIDRPQEEHVSGTKKLTYDDVLYLLLGMHYHFVRVQSILKISAASEYTEVLLTSGKKGLIRKAIKVWEERLPGDRFVRIHRSTIVNLEYVDRITQCDNNTSLVYLKGLTEPETMSRNYQGKIKSRMR